MLTAAEELNLFCGGIVWFGKNLWVLLIAALKK